MTADRAILPTASGRETRAALTHLVRPYRLRALLTLLSLIAASAVGLVGPLMMGRIVDIVVDGRGTSALLFPVVLLFVVSAGQGALTAASFGLLAALGETLLADVREQAVDKALRLPLSVLEAAGSGDLASRIGGDVAVIANAVRNVFPTLAGSALTILLTVVGLAALDPRFALAGLCAAPIQVGTLIWYLRRSTPMYARERVLEGERAERLLDAVEGAATVRAFRLHETQTAGVEARSLEAMDYSWQVLLLRTRFFARVNTAEFVGLGAILIAGFFLVRAGASTVGATTAAALFFHRIFDPVSNVLLNFDEGQKAASGLARLVGIAHIDLAEAAIRDAAAPVPAISVRNVTFAYDAGHSVLEDVSIEVAAGERIALVGPSGAGKTTLAKLIAGIHPPLAGELEIGGLAAGEAAQGLVALVTQEVHVFAGTLADDLRLARTEATVAELEAALERVGALEWAFRLPQGLDTAVGEGSLRLTASQAQQVALARLILANPRVAILDEATAEAGSAGARILERAADAAIDGRTAIVVAHRLTQARRADRIVLMESGRVVESGSHDELLARGGAYARLWGAWSELRTDAAVAPLDLAR